MPRRKPDTITKQRAFIAAYAATGSVKHASKGAEIDRHTHSQWMKTDEAYRGAFEETLDEVGQTLEDEAVRRAYEGVKRPVMYKGLPVKVRKRILYEVEYSDTLLLALLKRFRPALYRERVTAEVTGSIDIVDRLQNARKRLIEMKAKDAATPTG